MHMDILMWHKYNKECAYPNEYELTPYLSDDKNAPVIIVCPGGGYRMIAAFIEGHPVAKFFQEQGFNAFVLRYRVKKKAHYPAPLEDIAHALTDVKEKYGLSLDNYALCGFSAGGHMCGLFGVKEYGYEKFGFPKPNTLMLVYPVISLEKKITHWSTRKYFCGEEDKEAEEIGNLHHHVTSEYPSTFIWRGNVDRSVKHINSDLMIDELIKNNVNCEYYKYKKVGHCVGLGEHTEAKDWPMNAVKFWKKNFK